MPVTIPLPVRIAAGVVATGLERLRNLPKDLPALSVTVAGHAARASLRVQQEIVALAAKGDDLLAGLTSRPTERPDWARFDDESTDEAEPDARVDPTGNTSDVPGARVGPGDPTGSTADPDHARTAAKGRRSRGTEQPIDKRAARHSVTDTVTADDKAPTDPEPDGPIDMPGYGDLRVTQVRARLRGLDEAAVKRLLDYERAGAARAPFLTLLGNRLASLRSAADPQA